MTESRLMNAAKRSVVFDSNVVIRYINKKPGFIDIKTEYAEDVWLISFITRMEVLGFPHISAAERLRTLEFLQAVFIIPFSDKIEAAAIEIRRIYNPKLPDAIIAATARGLGASLVTGDRPLAKKKIPDLPIIFVPSPSDKAPLWKVFKSSVKRNRSLWIALGCLVVSTVVFAIL